MRRATIVALILLFPAAGCRERADLVVLNGVVWTGASSGGQQPGAVAVRAGHVFLVADSAAVAGHIGDRTMVLDAGGGLVMPGFGDGHTHFVSGGFQLASVDLRDAATPAEFVRRVAAYARGLAPGTWILGGDWDHELWPGAPLPRRDWIDSVTRDHPVFVSRLDGHMALANSAALRAAGITRDTPTPEGGEIPRDALTGEPQGVFKDEAMALVWAAVPAPTPEQTDSALARALAHAAASGVTATSHVSVTWEELASWRRLHDAGRLTLRAYLYLPLSLWRAVAETLRVHGAGDDWLRIAGLKGMVDGSAGSRTAYFFEPFADSAGYAGLLVTPEESLDVWIGNAIPPRLQSRCTPSATGPTRCCSTSPIRWPARTASATAASATSTRSTSAARRSSSSAAVAWSVRCSPTTRSTMAGGSTDASATSAAARRTRSVRCSGGRRSRSTRLDGSRSAASACTRS
jgi:predicted amidohydrolase YtcJ